MKKTICLLASAAFLLACPISFASTAIPANASYNLAFSPRAGSQELVLQVIQSARQRIVVASYDFTSKPLALALVEAKKRGVYVALVADRKNAGRAYSVTSFIANQGVLVRLNGKYPIHHNKFLLVDGQHVETGSFNFTAGALKNAENVLVLWNVPQLAAQYETEWQRLWNEAEPLPPRY